MEKPAILNGKPIFEKAMPIIKPNANEFAEECSEKIRNILKSNMLTNVNIYVREFEKKAGEYLKVKNAIAISSGTSGLILSLHALGIKNKEIILPSFTFSASVHACYWNNCKIIFGEIDDTFTLDIEDVKNKITKKTSAIMGVHMYGNPCNIKALKEIAEDNNLKIVYDAAHAFGSKYFSQQIGSFGDAEVFSLSPTKLITTFEGGLITTNDKKFAEKLRVLRNYGNNADYTCDLPGLNARMPEVNAILGISMMEHIDEYVKNRNNYVSLFKKGLIDIKGISYQKIRENCVSTNKDFSLIIDEKKFGMNRDYLEIALQKENISTKKYFFPPMHKLKAYKNIKAKNLDYTEKISNNVLSLPIYNKMEKETIEKICFAIKRIYENAEKVKEVIR